MLLTDRKIGCRHKRICERKDTTDFRRVEALHRTRCDTCFRRSRQTETERNLGLALRPRELIRKLGEEALEHRSQALRCIRRCKILLCALIHILACANHKKRMTCRHLSLILTYLLKLLLQLLVCYRKNTIRLKAKTARRIDHR